MYTLVIFPVLLTPLHRCRGGGVAEALGNLGVRLFKPLAIGGNRRRLAVDRAGGDAEEHRRRNLARDRRSLTQWRI